MHTYYALMAMIGQLTVCYLLGYPIEWFVTRTLAPVLNYLDRKHTEWDESYRT